jgi:hypothetical protein
MHFELADLGELADKIPQPEFVEVHFPALDRHFAHHRYLLRSVAGLLRFLGPSATWGRNMVNACHGKRETRKPRVSHSPKLKIRWG